MEDSYGAFYYRSFTYFLQLQLGTSPVAPLGIVPVINKWYLVCTTFIERAIRMGFLLLLTYEHFQKNFGGKICIQKQIYIKGGKDQFWNPMSFVQVVKLGWKRKKKQTFGNLFRPDREFEISQGSRKKPGSTTNANIYTENAHKARLDTMYHRITFDYVVLYKGRYRDLVMAKARPQRQPPV